MADADNMEEEDLFADLSVRFPFMQSPILTCISYDNDESAPSKEQITAAVHVPEPAEATEAPGYGEEPDTGHDPSAFENDTGMQEQPTNGAAMEAASETHEYTREEEPGIRMKEDG
jgi:hypothetical protein